MTIDHSTIAALNENFARGKSVTESAKAVGVHRNTAGHYLKEASLLRRRPPKNAEDEESLEEFWKIRWHSTGCRPTCPFCGSHQFIKLTRDRFGCGQCFKYFTARTGTPFEWGKKPLAFYIRALRMFQAGMNPLYVSRILKIDHKTTYRWQKFFLSVGVIGEPLFSSVNTVFELRERITNRLIQQASSFEAALREARWRGVTFRSDGTSLKFYLTQIQRPGCGGKVGRSSRYGSRWPSAKLADFREDWKAGMRAVDLCEKYDTSQPTIIRMQRKLRENFNPEHNAAMIYMLTEGMTIDEIAEHFQRAPDSVVRRLNYICPPENRSRLVRAKRQWSETNRARRREARRARKTQGSASLAIAASDAGQSAKGRFDDLGIPSSALAAINKKYARWDEARSRVLRSGTILQPT